MKSYEALARRYCAFLGEDPDELIEGLPIWRIALADLEAAINALDTFGVDARAPMSEDELTPSPDIPKSKLAPGKPYLRRVA